MRRRVGVGLAVASAAAGAAMVVGTLTSSAAPPASPVRVAGLHQTAASRPAGPSGILSQLAAPGGLARYHLPTGQLVWAQACVAGTCAAHQFASASPRCQGGACLAPARTARRYPGGLVITVEEW